MHLSYILNDLFENCISKNKATHQAPEIYMFCPGYKKRTNRAGSVGQGTARTNNNHHRPQAVDDQKCRRDSGAGEREREGDGQP